MLALMQTSVQQSSGKNVRDMTDIAKQKSKMRKSIHQDSNAIPDHLEIKSEWENITLSTAPLRLVVNVSRISLNTVRIGNVAPLY